MKDTERPKYNLESIKLTFNRIEKLNMTYSAMQSQYELEFNDQDVVDAIQALTYADFYKSMPPKHKHYSAWHDVYKSVFKKTNLYIKFQIEKNEMIISFKKR